MRNLYHENIEYHLVKNLKEIKCARKMHWPIKFKCKRCNMIQYNH